MLMSAENAYPTAVDMPGPSRTFLLRNAGGMTVTISERHAAVLSWLTPDRHGRMENVLLGYANESGAGSVQPVRWRGYHGDGVVSLLAQGISTDKQVCYRLTDDGCLVVEYDVMAGFPVPLKTRPGPYFNLSGCGVDIGDHLLQIHADYFAQADAAGAPFGIVPVSGQLLDFRQPAKIGARLSFAEPQHVKAGGFDHCFFIGDHVDSGQSALREAANVLEPFSGRRLRVFTTEAALNFRSCLDGLCLEPVACPEAASATWPRLLLRPGQMYRQTTVYRMSVEG